MLPDNEKGKGIEEMSVVDPAHDALHDFWDSMGVKCTRPWISPTFSMARDKTRNSYHPKFNSRSRELSSLGLTYPLCTFGICREGKECYRSQSSFHDNRCRSDTRFQQSWQGRCCSAIRKRENGQVVICVDVKRAVDGRIVEGFGSNFVHAMPLATSI